MAFSAQASRSAKRAGQFKTLRYVGKTAGTILVCVCDWYSHEMAFGNKKQCQSQGGDLRDAWEYKEVSM